MGRLFCFLQPKARAEVCRMSKSRVFGLDLMRSVLSDWGISGGMGWYVLYLFIAMGAAAVLHELVEKPVSRMRTQWAKRPS